MNFGKKKPLRWRAVKSSRIGAPRSRELVRDGNVYAIAQEIRGKGWFFYTSASNSSHNPKPLDEVEARGRDFVNRYEDSLEPLRKAK